ncbi:MAG: HEPN domain-containing protein [bacterium]|nr:HEPN domain-containing protein [bacterium]
MAITRSIEKLEILIYECMKDSKERLKAANLLLENGLYRDSISRSYYAFLDIAEALLLTKDLRPKSHAGTMTLCNNHFVTTGIIDKKYGKWFKRIEKARLEADYDHNKTFTQQDAQEALDEAIEFVKVIEELIPELLKKQV